MSINPEWQASRSRRAKVVYADERVGNKLLLTRHYDYVRLTLKSLRRSTSLDEYKAIALSIVSLFSLPPVSCSALSSACVHTRSLSLAETKNRAAAAALTLLLIIALVESLQRAN